jgi:hypothetical protein
MDSMLRLEPFTHPHKNQKTKQPEAKLTKQPKQKLNKKKQKKIYIITRFVNLLYMELRKTKVNFFPKSCHFCLHVHILCGHFPGLSSGR